MNNYDRANARVVAFYDKRTGSFQYVISDKETKAAAIIDPVLDYDPRAAATSTTNADAIADYDIVRPMWQPVG